MKLICMFLGSLLLANASTVSKLTGRIVNGTPANIDDYPYQISLREAGDHICGGSILNERVILTAAHCTENVITEDISIHAGSSIESDDNGQKIQASKIINHPNYDNVTVNKDIALIILEKALVFGKSVQPIPIATSDDDIAYDEMGKVCGWGYTEEEGEVTDELLQIELPILEPDVCQYIYGKTFTENMLCAGYPNGGKDTCQGDSGGPFVQNGKQVGIVSFGYGCGRPKSPGIYTHVPKLHQWILDNMAL